jgi:squalene cyclase
VRDRVKEGIDVALTYLRWRQAADGSWNGDAATTALVLRAFVDSPRKYREDDGPFIRRPIAFLIGQLTPAGSVGHGPRAELATAATVLALESVDRARYAETIARGRQWLRSRANGLRASGTYAAALILEAAGDGRRDAAAGDWRAEMATRLLALQRKDGGWGGDEETAIALDALELLYDRPL